MEREHRWLDGEDARPDRIAGLTRAAVDLAGFLAALRRVDAAGGPPPKWSNGFRGGPFGDDRDSPIVETRIRPKVAALEGLVDPAPSNLPARDGRLSAVIDFGTLAVGDPACDLIAAWLFLDAAVREVFHATLPIDDATWARGRGWGLADPVRGPEVRSRLDAIVADFEAGQ